MSEIEDPTTTLLRLIDTKLQVIKDNGGIAKILASEQAIDRELLLKEYDAQITLAIDPALGVQDQKLNLKGNLRRRLFHFKCTTHSIDKPSMTGADVGKVMRNKVTAQLVSVFRENRTNPNQATYTYNGLGYPNGDPHKAYTANAVTELSPSDTNWIELTTSDYQNIWASDENHATKNANLNGQNAMMLFKFKTDARTQTVKKLSLAFEGYGTSPTGNGATIKIWNHQTQEWQQTQTSNGNTDQTLTITVQTNPADFLEPNGNVYLLAKTTNPSNETTPATLYCNFAQMTIQVNGITYCDLYSYKLIDITDVKPFIFKTEFTLKGWLIETIPQ